MYQIRYSNLQKIIRIDAPQPVVKMTPMRCVLANHAHLQECADCVCPKGYRQGLPPSNAVRTYGTIP